MKPSESDIEFYQSICPALKDGKWEWSDHQSFLSPRAVCFTGRIQFQSLEEGLASVHVYYHNNGTRCWFSVTVIRSLGYPTFIYNKVVDVDAYKVDSNTLFTQANMQGSLLLQSKMEEIKAKEQEWLDELERISP
jgi:hypothetical protein